MPGSIQPITETLDHFPASLYTSYSTTYTRHVRTNEYPDGSSQRASDVVTSRRSWRFSRRLTAAQLTELRTFYFAHIHTPFLFHDLLTDQNVKAVFSSPWNESRGLGRSMVSLELVEVY